MDGSQGEDIRIYGSPEAAHHLESLSLRTFLASFTTSVALFVIQLFAFMFLRMYFKQIYQPRASLQASFGWWKLVSWIPSVVKTSDEAILERLGLETYLLDRYLRVVIRLFLIPSITVAPVLIALNITGGSANEVGGLDRLGWANIQTSKKSLYWAHLTMAVALVSLICWTLFTELTFYVTIRLAYMMSLSQFSSQRTSNVVISNVSRKSQEALYAIQEAFSDQISSYTLYKDLPAACRKDQERLRTIKRLERIELDLIKRSVTLDTDSLTSKDNKRQNLSTLAAKDMKTIARLTEEISCTQSTLDIGPLPNHVFIEFKERWPASLISSGILTQSLHDFRVRLLDGGLEGLRWQNLSKSYLNYQCRYLLTLVLIATLQALWTIPVAFTGFLSQVSTVGHRYHQFHWLTKLPDWASGILQGVLPQIALSALTAVLPQLLRFIVGLRLPLTDLEIEQSLQVHYFLFLFVQSFLTVSLSSSATGMIRDLTDGVSSVPKLISRNLPKASNYFISYIMLHGFTLSAGSLLQIGNLVASYALTWLDQTPRQKLERYRAFALIRWGALYPLYTNFACIGLIYSIITPIICPITALAFAVFWFVSRYNFLYICTATQNIQSKQYPTALKQLLTGLYVMQLCLLGLFLSTNNDVGIIQASIMACSIVLTIFYHYILCKTFNPLLDHFPAFPCRPCHSDRAPSFFGRLFGTAVVSPKLKASIDHFIAGQERGKGHGPRHFLPVPTILIPRDERGYSDREIAMLQSYCKDVGISNEFASLNSQGQLSVRTGGTLPML